MTATQELIRDLKLWACSPRVPTNAQLVMLEAIGRLSAPTEARQKTVKTFDGEEPAVLVAASWIIREYECSPRSHGPDHACVECVPHGDSIIAGFRCYYHEAKALVSPQREKT